MLFVISEIQGRGVFLIQTYFLSNRILKHAYWLRTVAKAVRIFDVLANCFNITEQKISVGVLAGNARQVFFDGVLIDLDYYVLCLATQRCKKLDASIMYF